MIVPRFKYQPSSLGIASALLAFNLLLACAAGAADPPAPAPTPSGSQQADAEILLDEYTVVDRVVAQGFERSITEHRVIRVLTAAGAAAQGTMSIPYFDRTVIEELIVICTAPNGRKTHVQPEKMFDRVTLQLGSMQMRERAFPLPGIVAGSTIEYRLLERTTEPDHLLPLWLTCQRDIPAREVRVSVRPWPEAPFVLRTNAVNGKASPVTRDADGRLHLTIRDVPSYHQEPLMPPEVETRLCIFGTYMRVDLPPTPLTLVADGTEMNRNYGNMSAHADSAQKIAQRLTEGLSNPEDRARRLYQFCREEIRNSESGPDSGRVFPAVVYPEERTLQAVFQQRMASADNINLAFATLANAAGFDVHLAWGIAPGHLAFDSTFATYRGFSFVAVMLKHESGWWYCQPGDYWLPFGTLSPDIEGAPAVFTGGPRAVLGHIPTSPATESAIERAWNVRVSLDGRLEGTVHIRATGHLAADFRKRLRGLVPTESEHEFGRFLLEQHPSAEVDSIVADNVEKIDEPLTWSFRIAISGYAQSAGGTLLLPVTPFAPHLLPGFSAAQREHPVCLPFAWTTTDRVRIQLPRGAVAEALNDTTHVDFAGLGHGETELRAGPDSREVVFDSRQWFGGDQRPRVLAQDYSVLVGALARGSEAARARVAVRIREAGRR